MPPPQESEINYDDLYPSTFKQPSSYIRSSQTVEECISCQYDMTSDDDAFLKGYNGKSPAGGPLSDDDFERIMEVFEDTAAEQTPFASVDNTIVPYDIMAPTLAQLNSQSILQHAKAVYEYWKQSRQEGGNKPLHPQLKFETHQETDDTDPYVCFRRREARQTRKTRGRDNKVAETLKRLRRELENGRQLVLLSAERESTKRDLLNIDRALFEERARLKQIKTKLGIKESDDDLVHQKVSISDASVFRTICTDSYPQPQKRKVVEAPVVQRQPGAHLRMPVRPDGRNMEADLVQLVDKLVEKDNEFRADIEMKVQNHRKWNQNHIDLTRDPLSPVKDQGAEQKFRPAKTQYLMTPPASIESDEMDVDEPVPDPMDIDQSNSGSLFQFKAGGAGEPEHIVQAAFRRRIGRLNRLWIDRKGMMSPPRMDMGGNSDRWKYDTDSDDDEPDVYEVDPFDTRALKFRATIPLNSYPYRGRQPVPQEGAANGQRQLPPAVAAVAQSAAAASHTQAAATAAGASVQPQVAAQVPPQAQRPQQAATS